MPKKKLLAYVRVSTEDQSVDMQIHDLEEWAEREDWELKIYTESESTRKTRPILEEVLRLLRVKKYDGLVVWKMDRLARSMVHMITLLEEFHNQGLLFRSYKEPEINFDSAFGKAMVGLIGIFAQLERDLIRERTKSALRTKKAQGKKLGRPRRHLVQDIYDMIYAGHTNRQIADALDYSMRTIQRIRKNTGKMEATETPPENPTPNQAQKVDTTKTNVYDAERNNEGVSKVTL